MASYSPRHGEQWLAATNTDLSGVAQGSTVYFRVIGAGGNSSTETDVEFLTPDTGKALKLVIETSQNDSGCTVTLRKNGADTSLSVSQGAGVTGEASTTGEVSFTEGDEISIELTVSGGSVGDQTVLDRWSVVVEVDE